MRTIRRLLVSSLFSFLFFAPTIFLFAQTTTLASPSDATTDVSLQPTFLWTSGTPTEQFEIATDNGFTNIVLTKSFSASETSYTLTEAEKLTNGSTYYWRVSIDGGTSWSSIFSFTVIGAVPITLHWPLDLSNVYISDVYFTWSSWAAGVNLKFQVEVTSKTSGGLPDWTQTPDFQVKTTALYTSFSLLMGKTYYWRIIVLNAGDNDEPISYS